MQQREDSWRRRLDREIEKRRKIEETNRILSQELVSLQNQCSSSKTSINVSANGICPTTPSASSRKENNIVNTNKLMMMGSPDMQEGPNCAIGEDEFFDAVDAQLDQMECKSLF